MDIITRTGLGLALVAGIFLSADVAQAQGPQAGEEIAREMATLSDNLARVQGTGPSRASGIETVDHVASTASKVLILLGQKSKLGDVEAARGAAAAANNLSGMITRFRDVAQSSVKSCNFNEVIELGNEAAESFNTATAYLNRRRGGKGSARNDRKDIPMTNYVSNWINSRLTGNQETQARLKAQQLLGQLEQACQTAVTLSDLRSQIKTVKDAQRAITETVGPMFQRFTASQGNSRTVIPGTDTSGGRVVGTKWVVQFDNAVASASSNAEDAVDPNQEALSLVTREAAGTTQDILVTLGNLNNDLLNYQKQLLVFAEVRLVKVGDKNVLKLSCPEGGPSVERPAPGEPGHDTWTPLPTYTDYAGRVPVLKSICGYVPPARATELMAAILAADVQLDALVLKLNAMGTRIVTTQTAGENIGRAKDEATMRRGLSGF